MVSGGNITVGEVETQGTISTLTLSFSPVLTSNGGKYECRAAISVSWMESQPPQLSALVNMPVISKSNYSKLNGLDNSLLVQLKLSSNSKCILCHTVPHGM